MMKIVEHIKEKKKQYMIGMGIGVVSVTLLWLGIRDNSFAVSVDGQVVTVVKTKEEAIVAYESLVEMIKKEKGVDIAVKEEIGVEPVHSKPSEIKQGEDVLDSLKKAISYGVEAYEIIVDGQSQAVVESEEVALEILAEIAKSHLAEGAEVVLDSKNIILPTSEKEDTASVEDAEKSEEVVDQQKGERPDVIQGEQKESITTQVPTVLGNNEVNANQTTSTECETTLVLKEDNKEVIQLPDALPKEEIKNEIKVESVELSQAKKEEEPKEGQKILRELKGFDFNEEVTIKNSYVQEEEILTKEEGVSTLLGNTEEIVEYELKEGDNIWDIAVKHSTTMDHILEINPQIIDEKRMQIGEKIKLEVPEPILSISTVEQAIFKELIPVEIEYVEFSDLYKDETKVYQEGHDGYKEITVNVHKINGKEVSRDLISEKVLKEPKIRVMAYGTKEKPKPKPTQNNNNSNSSSSNKGNSSVKPSNSGQFMHPLNGAGRISSQYGSRWGSYHRGIDIAAPAGTPVYASASGTVVYSGYNNGGYGKMIIIDHGNGYKTYYAHNSSLYVQVGQKVSKGQNIAGVGSTGNSTGNHVHFELRKNDNPINPYNYIY
ncbi:MAG: peptidoglycan DD-metalloendopeptidase family protein [Cellulosilyticaceae bacterium]